MASRFNTIHGVKGEGHQAVMLYCPRPRNYDGYRCPAAEWWNGARLEERRVAFVATTRVQDVFMLCVHRETFAAFENSRAGFRAGFNVREL